MMLTCEPVSKRTVAGFPLIEHLRRLFFPIRGAWHPVVLWQERVCGWGLGFLGRLDGFLGVGLTDWDWSCAPVSGCPSAETGSRFPETWSASSIPLLGVLSLHTQSSVCTPAGSVLYIWDSGLSFLLFGRWTGGHDWGMVGLAMAGEGCDWGVAESGDVTGIGAIFGLMVALSGPRGCCLPVDPLEWPPSASGSPPVH